jgi:hypothetical protein
LTVRQSAGPNLSLSCVPVRTRCTSACARLETDRRLREDHAASGRLPAALDPAPDVRIH